MAAGTYRDRATFERKSLGALDAYGNPDPTAWAPVQALSGVPANLRETPGKEALAAGRLEAPVTATLRIRVSSCPPAAAITAADRVRVRGHIWKIIGGPIDPKGLGRDMEFTLERGGAVQ